MNFRQVDSSEQLKLKNLRAIASTLQFQEKVKCSLYEIERFLYICEHPVISCGGGKDSTAIGILSKMINPNIYIVCANPPNPLPDRAKHLDNLKDFLGGEWADIEYYWDVESVLSGEQRYPAGLKMKKLKEFQSDNMVDGVILGVRTAESKARRINCILRGTTYKVSDNTWRCLPISNWTAEETLALALYVGAPINPVYEKTHLMPDLEHLRDGTWWPHGIQSYGRDEWIKYYYPELYEAYDKATKLRTDDVVCTF